MDQVVGLTRLELPTGIGNHVGGELFAALLILGFQANEIQVFQMLLAANVQEHCGSLPFWQRKKIVSNTLVRTLGDRLYVGIKGVSDIQKVVKRSQLRAEKKSQFQEEFVSQILPVETWKKDVNYGILKDVRDTVNQHARPQAVAYTVSRTFAGASNCFYFGDHMANSFFPASEDFVFGSKLHNLLGGKGGETVDQVAYKRWLSWLIDTSADHLLLVQRILIWFVTNYQGYDLKDETHVLKRSYIGGGRDARLPLFFELSDAVQTK